MNYFSLNHNTPNVKFSEAVIRGLAPDKGLYFPESITPLPKELIDNIDSYSKEEIAFQAVRQFVGDEISENELRRIVAETINFDFPLVEVEPDIYSLELFHGPTLAFKDVGARFMARCLSTFSKFDEKKVTVLVATSGDTGGAVADGFLGVAGVDVVILYPSGKVSDIQERQLTTLGQNIKAFEVKGTFDDCQRMVKTAFLDEDLNKVLNLTSANSINVARWLPQMFYYFFAYQQLKDKSKKLVVSVPSGNFGNICAGMVAAKLGLPVSLFVASTNANKVVTEYLSTGAYEPKPSVQTISNAMDVGDPSNFVRIKQLHNADFNLLKSNLLSYSYSDFTTREVMAEVRERTGYILDPHGAVGYLGLKESLRNRPYAQGIFLETAHPCKFIDVVEETLNEKVVIPEKLQSLMERKKVSIVIDKDYDDLKQILLHQSDVLAV
ncbi:threonine synthase [Solitalea canadensis]|uniref:Threonine synthase n=1 Tax=Solitalea canadensis (strain ATCC 29591 / DSM 3403 / JCM 21819 / LMG 8368 / NBRC 15130 / NCIMB 12057 / USAM 9D) TaxID=929556 RepID=H8KLS7_SOLCM|nr:threonine synthase [Solitalea canadensis]AFD09231.1 threonine synthase [Solitalea canadensis DSM 3403]